MVSIKKVIFDNEFNEIFHDVTPVLLDAKTTAVEDDFNKQKASWLSKKENNELFCSCCHTTFANVQQQREHYRLDWHRYNLKRSLQAKPPVEEAEFNQNTENDEVSSISGSDTDEDEEQDRLDILAAAQGKIFLQNQSGQVFSLYRGILLIDKKEDIATVDLLGRYTACCVNNKQWAILMLGGGHFAGAIFDNLKPIIHKTFHCYTVRAGQGGTQSSKDNKSGGSHPKSAGASLRRYNEQALIDHVSNIVKTWSNELKKCSLIFYRASGPYNRGVLFGGKEPLLDRTDDRLRTIPFSTGRATFSEVKRVHLELCSAAVYESLQDATKQLSINRNLDQDRRRSKVPSSCINRAKSREVVERPLPINLSSADSQDDDTDDEFEEVSQLDNENIQISFGDLKEFDDSLTPEQRKRDQSRRKPRKSKTQKLKEQEEARRRNLIDVLIRGNHIILEDLLRERLKSFENNPDMSRQEIAKDFFNEVLDADGNSFLHLAAVNEHEEMLIYLLENNADPCLKNKRLQTPYSCTQSKISRDVLRKFAKENPDKYNYNKAQIPLNVLSEEEQAEKRRAARKVKREKEKEKKKENHLKMKEEDEKRRFVTLSDREKRALAAEKRILNVQGKVTARCFNCGADIAGKIPFEYMENRFCSIECLKIHRLNHHGQIKEAGPERVFVKFEK